MLLLLGATIFAGFIAVFIIALGGGPAIAIFMAIATTIALIIFFVALYIGKYPYKKLFLAMGLYLLVCLLVTGGYQINKYYIGNIPVVSDELNLAPYEPFIKDTKAVALNENATLKIEDQLPVMDGATALYPLYSAFARAVYPARTYNLYQSEVMCNNTINAYQNLIDGKADVIFVARPSQQQLDSAKAKGVELILTPIGKEAFVFFVNSGNKITGLTMDQIRKIYAGTITNWTDVGGSFGTIKAYQRPEGSGSQTMLIHVMKGYNLSNPPTDDLVGGMGGIIKRTAMYKNFGGAIGYSFLFYATEMVKNKEIKVLAIDGVQPNRKTIKENSYPLTAQFYAVTTNKAKPNTRKLISWILGLQGQFLIEKTGYTPIQP